MSESNENLYKALKRFFSFDSFLDNQEDIVSEILSGEDICVIMPTGAGKSLCYQLPLLMKDGYGIIVSPLISLMKDQVDSLTEKNVAAAFINSTVSFSEQQRIMSEAATGLIKLLYVAPERFQADSFRKLLEHQPPTTMIIDEAHCISQWGHDFRPSYLRIGDIASEFSIPQVCAFTATATPLVREDIRKQLKRPDMKLHVAGFKRPNLAFSIIEVGNNGEKITQIKKLLKNKAPTIIYASTRKAVEEIAAEIECRPYHAGMSDDARTETQDYFMNAPCPVLAATNAFGMGIDRPDVRRVIHYNITGSLEAYYQEAGRAGRDSEPAECILLYSYADRFIHEFLVDLNNPQENILRELYKTLRRLAAERKSTSLELTLGDIAAYIPQVKSDSQLSSAMQILEKYGYVERGFRNNSSGTLRFTGKLSSLRPLHFAQATQRSRFIYRMIVHYGEALEKDAQYNYGELCSVAGLNLDQIKRVLHALHGDCLHWTPPFNGRVTTLLKPDEEALDIDFSELSTKRNFELARLDDVIEYTRSKECRQRFLVNYFGETVEDWQCESCDLCTSGTHANLRDPLPDELVVIKKILTAAIKFNGRYGRGRISQVLAGLRTAQIVDSGLDEHPCFDMLKGIKQSNILLYMKALENNGDLVRTGDPQYPCLAVSSQGKKLLHGESTVKLDFAPVREVIMASAEPAKKKKSRSKKEEEAEEPVENIELLARLKELRRELAQENNIPPYCIFSDKTLRELARNMPENTEEALELHGIGPGKAETVLPAFLELIKDFREA